MYVRNDHKHTTKCARDTKALLFRDKTTGVTRHIETTTFITLPLVSRTDENVFERVKIPEELVKSLTPF